MSEKAKKRKTVYLQRKKQGDCPRCGKKRKKNSKYIYCDDCREFFRSYNEKISKKINKIRKKRYDDRKKGGKCPRCGKSLGKKYTKTICPACLEKQYKYNYGKAKSKKK